jgi:hypothetical protein
MSFSRILIANRRQTAGRAQRAAIEPLHHHVS